MTTYIQDKKLIMNVLDKKNILIQQNKCTTLIVYFSLLLIFFSCQYNNKDIPAVKEEDFSEEMISLNKEIARREKEDIELIAKRYKWNLIQTESGLYYQIINQTKGEYPQKKDKVKIKGIIMLTNGKEIYNSTIDGVKEFTVNMSDEFVGLHELVRLMRVGEKANAIVPSYLAYGASGNGADVPPLSSLICKLELININ
jgi:FKBP-type peptidyl-prolyl cis-trans isomerase FkpA